MTINLHSNKTGRLPIAKQGDSLLSSCQNQDWKIMWRREPLVGVGTLIDNICCQLFATKSLLL